MKIAIATDHNGVNEKKELIRLLSKYEFLDKSPVNPDTDDYPDFAFEVANSVVSNKVKGIRCGHCSTKEQAHLTKEHNHANVIALSYKQDINELAEMIEEFIETAPSTEERHQRRVDKIMNYEIGA